MRRLHLPWIKILAICWLVIILIFSSLSTSKPHDKPALYPSNRLATPPPLNLT